MSSASPEPQATMYPVDINNGGHDQLELDHIGHGLLGPDPTNDLEFFYHNDGNIVFLVESTLFKVHQYHFIEESPVFRDMLSLPKSVDPGVEFEGSDQNPIHLEHVKADAFRSLLWFFYKSHFGSENLSNSEAIKTWINILHLSKKWMFDRVLVVASKALSPLRFDDPVEKICVAAEFEFPATWAVDAYQEIYLRVERLSLSEVSRLPASALVSIMSLREQRLSARTKTAFSLDFIRREIDFVLDEKIRRF